METGLAGSAQLHRRHRGARHALGEVVDPLEVLQHVHLDLVGRYPFGLFWVTAWTAAWIALPTAV